MNDRIGPAGLPSPAGSAVMLETLIILTLVFCAVFLLPLLLLGLVFKVAFTLILLPFKILKGLLGILFGVAGFLLKGVVLLGLLLFVPFLVFGGAVLAVLFPVVLLVLVVWGLCRLLRPKTSVQPAV
jgi:hypothetical protein